MEDISTNNKSVSLIKFLAGGTNPVVLICVPVVCTKKDLSNILRKRIGNGFSNVYYVSWDDTITSYNITYDNLVKVSSESSNVIFIIDNIEVFNIYLSDLFDRKISRNKFLVMYEGGRIKGNLGENTYTQLFPTFLDLEVNFEFSERKSYMGDDQSRAYLKKYSDYQKINRENILIEEDPKEIPEISGIQNILIDNVLSSSYNNLDIFFSRSPKFRSIITDILLHNKKRHFISMIGGKYGIDNFESIYNLVTGEADKSETMFPYLMIIKSSDSMQEKIAKLREFNSSNRPMILLTNFNFGKDLIPKNIDFVRLTNGGRREDIYAIASFVKAENYTGNYPRKLEIICYTSIIKNNIISLDQENYKNFTQHFTHYLKYVNLCKNSSNSVDMYLKGEEIYLSLKHEF